MSQAPLRVCLDARFPDGQAGGLQQVVIGLASSFSEFTEASEEYYFLGGPETQAWLQPYLRGPCKLLPMAPPAPPSGLALAKKTLFSAAPVIQRAWQQVRSVLPPKPIKLPPSDGTIEKAGIDLMHFTWQHAFLTDVPSIYQPHDLLHVHFPELFKPTDVSWREAAYGIFCQRASLVSIMSTWGKQDLVDHYGLPPDKVIIVPWAPVISSYPIPTQQELLATAQKFSLPAQFVFYPAQTYAHKNHLLLLEVLALLRDEHGVRIPLVSSGTKNNFFATIEQQVHALGLEDQVQFLGYVTPVELQCLYRLSQCMVFPSKFEGWGLPIVEAFLAKLPVACSNATVLPALVGDAALIFDCSSPTKMAAAIKEIWTDEQIRKHLAARGEQRAKLFSWARTARMFRAHYRQLAKRPLTGEDRELLAARPIV